MKITVKTRVTKYGPEDLSKDIPYLSESKIKHLDNNGIVMKGTYVNPGMILVGKVKPNRHLNSGEIELAKLNIWYFGDEDLWGNSSYIANENEQGIVVNVAIKNFFAPCFDFQDYYALTIKELPIGTILQQITIHLESKNTV